jgi:hypothetical protein
VQISITYHPYKNGTKLCDQLNPSGSCVVVQNGKFEVILNHGECQVLVPQT